MAKHVVAAIGEIPSGGKKLVSVGGREVGIFNIDNQFYGLINRCLHQGAPLCEGTVYSKTSSSQPGEYKLVPGEKMIRCPWHCWEFDIKTGQSWCDPNSVRAKAYKVDVENGAERAKGPFVAETCKVVVEDDYVVLEL